MAKKPEYDMTPLQVAQVAAERHSKFDAWAASVASTIVASSLGEKLLEKMQKNNLVELTKLENSIGQHLVLKFIVPCMVCRTNRSCQAGKTVWINRVVHFHQKKFLLLKNGGSCGL